MEQSCWNGLYQADMCCDPRLGPTGRNECWDDGFFTYDNCCRPHFAVQCKSSDTIWAGMMLLLLSAIWIVVIAQWTSSSKQAGTSSTAEDTTDDRRDRHESSRMAVLDTAKFLLMSLVVMGHSYYNEAWFLPSLGIHRFIGGFHTRTFCLISGFNCRNPLHHRSLRNSLFQLFVPLLLALVIIDPVLKSLLASLPKFPLQNFHWYLCALICWRSWSILLAPLKPVGKLIAAIAISGVGSYFDLSFESRSLSFVNLNAAAHMFPIFVVGQQVQLENILRRLPPWRCTTALGIGLLSLICGIQESTTLRTWFDSMNLPAFMVQWKFCDSTDIRFFCLYWIRGLFVHVFETTKGVIFILCCPRSRSIASDLGQFTVYPLMLHLHAIRVWRLFVERFMDEPVLSFAPLATFIAAFAITAFLASRPVRAALGIFIQPTWMETLLC